MLNKAQLDKKSIPAAGKYFLRGLFFIILNGTVLGKW